ncbi:hypothetical protein QBC40DRAFT_274128 [Triangularia verruculosa]|uniref:Uncharacterized protein n=1 Tax=Triangularia verruculosa TaxID=2587418 RepID=A0AAN6XNE9_9PEZI|nr:hypothetical protein QBC40DRAFT_274128 [Triangularia verruculosa]
MFEVPGAKRVRREDLYSSSDEEDVQDNGASPQDADILRQKLSSLLAIDLAAPPPQNATEVDVSMVDADQEPAKLPSENEANQEEEEFVFRLFSSAPVQTVVLAPKDDEVIASAEDVPFKERPISYYIQQPLSPEEQEKIRHSALSGQDVLALSKQRAWGLEVPWRVTKIEIVSNKKPVKSTGGGKVVEEEDKKKKRPGKKTRIKLRIREQKRKEEEGKKLTKEEHLKEKKKRLNREKKLKRRQKEKAKKAVNGTADGQEGGGDKMSEDEGGSGEE